LVQVRLSPVLLVMRLTDELILIMGRPPS